MSNIGDSERKIQNKVVRFFEDKLKYEYIGNLADKENSNIMENRLSAYLRSRGYSEVLIRGAIDKLKKTSLNLQQGLYFANREVYLYRDRSFENRKNDRDMSGKGGTTREKS